MCAIIHKKRRTTVMGKNKDIVVAVSGGFDPLHAGHLRLFEEAKKLGTRLVVILNNDNWLINKKGYAFMPEYERAAIIGALRVVDEVVLTKHVPDDPDTSVSKALAEVKPDIFANAGDRKDPDALPSPENIVCAAQGTQMRFFRFDDLHLPGGEKKHSSSHMVRRAAEYLGKPGKFAG
jgi:D-beta-D-heptose 7-phosphate kinase/D-beta-D-heptose 1-phosphate adenosyltransferase